MKSKKRKNDSFTNVKTLNKINIYELEDIFRPSNDIFNEDDITIFRLKKIIQSVLNETERRIILCYAELGNIRDTAALFKVSPTTIFNQIKNIKKKIKDKLYEYNN